MSSGPYKLGLSVVDNFKYVNPESFRNIPVICWPTRHFILKSNDYDESLAKILDMRAHLPTHMCLKIKWIGTRPDRKVPIAKHFCEIEIGPAMFGGTINFINFWDDICYGLYKFKGE